MRTRISCGWLVGHGERGHELWRNGELVYEGDKVVFVGEKFDGAVDREIDARERLVTPGFIDTHVHSGHRASHRLISDVGRPDYFGQPFLEISVAKEGTRVGGDPRYARPDDRAAARQAWADAASTGKLEVEARICRASEKGFRWFQIRAQPVRDAGGDILEWLGASTVCTTPLSMSRTRTLLPGPSSVLVLRTQASSAPSGLNDGQLSAPRTVGWAARLPSAVW